jgi:hypothetical protein
LAHGRALQISDESAPTILQGSSVLHAGAGSNHRTLASFLWGDAPLEHDRNYIEIVKDELDSALWRACEQLENACPPETRRLGLSFEIDHKPEDLVELRQRLIDLGEQAERDEDFSCALCLRSYRRLPRDGLGIVSLAEIEALASTHRGRLARQWQRKRLDALNRRRHRTQPQRKP